MADISRHTIQAIQELAALDQLRSEVMDLIDQHPEEFEAAIGFAQVASSGDDVRGQFLGLLACCGVLTLTVREPVNQD